VGVGGGGGGICVHVFMGFVSFDKVGCRSSSSQ